VGGQTLGLNAGYPATEVVSVCSMTSLLRQAFREFYSSRKIFRLHSWLIETRERNVVWMGCCVLISGFSGFGALTR